MAKKPDPIPMPSKSMIEEFTVPAQDRQGHSVAVNFRIPPGMMRDTEMLMQHKHIFGWKTNSDFLRWAMRHGFEYAAKRSGDKQIISLGEERKMWDSILATQQTQIDMTHDMERMEQLVRDLVGGGHKVPLIKTLQKAKKTIDNIEDEYWRGHYQRQFAERFGQHLKAISLTDFSDE